MQMMRETTQGCVGLDPSEGAVLRRQEPGISSEIEILLNV